MAIKDELLDQLMEGLDKPAFAAAVTFGPAQKGQILYASLLCGEFMLEADQ